LFNDEDFIDFDKINKDEPLQLREMEILVREKYFTYIRRKCNSDAEAAKVLGLAPPNYHRMTKELGIK